MTTRYSLFNLISRVLFWRHSGNARRHSKVCRVLGLSKKSTTQKRGKPIDFHSHYYGDDIAGTVIFNDQLKPISHVFFRVAMMQNCQELT
jgi:hypothetical protein